MINAPEVMIDRAITAAVLFGVGWIVYKKAIGESISFSSGLGKFTKWHK